VACAQVEIRWNRPVGFDLLLAIVSLAKLARRRATRLHLPQLLEVAVQ
jgi:hypothetical protein